MGTWKHTTGRTVGALPCWLDPRWYPARSDERTLELRELNTASVDGNTFDGTYDQTFFDADGNLVFEDIGTIHATRSVRGSIRL